MSLTDAQKLKVRVALGYPATYLNENPSLNDALSLVSADENASAMAVAILAKLDALETKIEESYSSAGIKKVDEVEFFGDSGESQRSGLNAQGRRLVGQLSALFGIRILSDIFGPNGYGTDGWQWSAWHPFVRG